MRYLSIVLAGLLFLGLGQILVMAEDEVSAEAEVSTETGTKTQAQIDSLIKNLGAEDWQTREKVTEELKAMGEASLPALQKATESDDPEISWRAKLIMRSIEKSKKKRMQVESHHEARPQVQQRFIKLWPGKTLSSRVKIFINGSGPGAKSFSFSTDASGKVTATVQEENQDGKVQEKTYTAENMEEFKKKYPELVKQYGIDINEPSEIEIPEFKIDPDDIWEDFSKSWSRRWDELNKELEAMRKALRGGNDPDWFMPRIERRQPPRVEKEVLSDVDDLGIDVEYIEPALRTQLDLKGDNGVLVNKVKPDSAGSRIGFEPHDIILEINKQPIKTVWEFRRLVKAVLDKGTAQILIIRKGEKKTLNFNK